MRDVMGCRAACREIGPDVPLPIAYPSFPYLSAPGAKRRRGSTMAIERHDVQKYMKAI